MHLARFQRWFPPCEFPFELKPPLLLLLFDELVLPFAALPPFPRRLRRCPRPPCLRNSRAPPCNLVQHTAVTSCIIIMNGDFTADLRGVIRGSTTGDIFDA